MAILFEAGCCTTLIVSHASLIAFAPPIRGLTFCLIDVNHNLFGSYCLTGAALDLPGGFIALSRSERRLSASRP